MKHLINNACQLKLLLGMLSVTSLFISYNIKAKSVCVAASEEIDIDILTMQWLTPPV